MNHKKQLFYFSFLVWLFGLSLSIDTRRYVDWLKIDGDVVALVGYSLVVFSYIVASLNLFVIHRDKANTRLDISLMKALGLAFLLCLLSWIVFIIWFIFAFAASF